MTSPRNIIIEGIDRLGKSTLIEGLLQELGYFQVIHYEKPKLLQHFLDQAITEFPEKSVEDQKLYALMQYQVKSFQQMFSMLSYQSSRFIMDRAHLGEAVYAPRYRKYSGDYVFAQEDLLLQYSMMDFSEVTLLVLLYTSDFSFIIDDGLSFDFSKKEEEQVDFIKAFEKSFFKNKLMIDVCNGQGGFKEPNEILNAVKNAFLGLQSTKVKI